MSDKKQIPGLPVATEAKDNDRLIKRDMDSGSDEGLSVSVLLERSSEQVDAHATEEGGIHGIPVGERALHTQDVVDDSKDLSLDRVLTRGYYGIGRHGPRAPDKNVDKATQSGFYSGRCGGHDDADIGDNPFPVAGGDYTLIASQDLAGTSLEYVFQLASRLGTDGLKFRSRTGQGFTEWKTIYHEGNLDDIVARGSNSDGDWIRFGDGTQICVSDIIQPSMDANVTMASGVTRSGSSGRKTWTFPLSFNSVRIGVYATNINGGGSFARVPATGGVSENSVDVSLTSYNGDTSGSEWVRVTAIGRWA